MPDRTFQPEWRVCALVYTDSVRADETLRAYALDCLESGLGVAGLVQMNPPRPGRSRCDMVLEDLASGDQLGISQDRGAGARGCALEVGQLLFAMEIVRASLTTEPDLVILNKFGKSEAEGGGFRPLIAEIVERDIPLVIGVPWRNIESWRQFVGDLPGIREHVLDLGGPDIGGLPLPLPPVGSASAAERTG